MPRDVIAAKRAPYLRHGKARPRPALHNAVLVDRVHKPVVYPRAEPVTRLLAGRCELCEEPAKVVVHQVQNLGSLGQPGMATRLGRAHGANYSTMPKQAVDAVMDPLRSQ